MNFPTTNTGPNDAVQRMQRHVAMGAASGSSLRNQGVKGMVAVAQKFLSTVAVSDFVVTSEDLFQKQLQQATNDLRDGFPDGGQILVARVKY